MSKRKCCVRLVYHTKQVTAKETNAKHQMCLDDDADLGARSGVGAAEGLKESRPVVGMREGLELGADGASDGLGEGLEDGSNDAVAVGDEEGGEMPIGQKDESKGRQDPSHASRPVKHPLPLSST